MDYHKKISYVKSAIRILGFCILPFWIMVGCGLLLIAEIFGIMEETEE